MRPAAVYGVLALLLVATGVVLPAALPDCRYEYEVESGFADPAAATHEHDPVSYRTLSADERAVFDAALDGDEPVTGPEPPSGNRLVAATDEGGYGNRLTAVVYRGENYTVDGTAVRPFFAIQYWGRPLLVSLGVLVGTLTVFVVAVGRARDLFG